MSRRDSYPPRRALLRRDADRRPRGRQALLRRHLRLGVRRPRADAGRPDRGEYFVARLRRPRRGRDRLAAPRPIAPPPPAWNTHVSVADADDDGRGAPRPPAGPCWLEPFDAPPAGRLAVLADPAGAVLCVWEPGSRQGAALVNEPSAWAMSLLSTDDPESAQAFYGELFGWQAEAFDAGPGMELWLWRLPGYVGGEPQQPVPRDVVAAMTRLDRPPRARGRTGASTSGSPTPTPRPRRPRARRAAWSPRRSRWPGSGGRSWPTRRERCSRRASSCSRRDDAGPDPPRVRVAPAQAGGHGRHDEAPPARRRSPARARARRRTPEPGRGQPGRRAPAVTVQPDGDARQPAPGQHDPAERPRAGGHGDAEAGDQPAAAIGAVGAVARHPIVFVELVGMGSIIPEPRRAHGDASVPEEIQMGFDQYHEPPDELPPATRTFARLCASLTEEAEAIGWYEQRLAVETDPEALAVMRDAQGEEFKHFSMDLEFLLRRTPVWREIAQGILFQPATSSSTARRPRPRRSRATMALTPARRRGSRRRHRLAGHRQPAGWWLDEQPPAALARADQRLATGSCSTTRPASA